MTLSIVGLGLIGGSIARDARACGVATHIVGYDARPEHTSQALELGLIDSAVDLPTAAAADLVVLAVPVDALTQLLPEVLNIAGPDSTLTDVGSTKAAVCAAVAQHPWRAQFVAAHPMAGTERSGPSAALQGLFQHKAVIVCEAERSNPAAIARVEALYTALGAHIVHLAPDEHDEHVAYVSHLSHAISYALAVTVLEKEKSASTLLDLASGGFASTARLAKSHAAMWTPIFLQNATHLLPTLAAYRRELDRLIAAIAAADAPAVDAYIGQANAIRRVLNGKA